MSVYTKPTIHNYVRDRIVLWARANKKIDKICYLDAINDNKRLTLEK